MNTIECACCHKPTPIIEEGLDHICDECCNHTEIIHKSNEEQLNENP